jgi:hypothetical protein
MRPSERPTVYIRNGQVTTERPRAGILELLMRFINMIVFFITSIFSTAPQRDRVDEFRARNRPGGGGYGGSGAKIHGLPKAATSGCTGGS